MTDMTSTHRQIIPLREKFFCDGPYYLITSSTLGGLNSQELASRLREGEPAVIEALLQDSVCIPVFFPGDCAMDQALILIGDLSAQEEAEWIGRISWKLNILCGKLLILCGGGDAEFTDGAVSGKGVSGFTDYFQQIDVPPGRYQAEVYAHLPSTTGNFYLESDKPMAEWQDWFRKDRKNEDLPAWLKKFDEYAVPGQLSDQLVSYIIRLAPLTTEPPSLPQLDPDVGWCTFETRRPQQCPAGIPRKGLLSQ